MITFRLPIKYVDDLYYVLEAEAFVRELTGARTGFRKKLDRILAEKGGEFRLWLALKRLAEFSCKLRDLPILVEGVVVPRPAGDGFRTKEVTS
jgi:hypothetical protein